MTGEHTIILRSNRVECSLTVRKKVTVIRGRSGSGRTTFVNMLDRYEGGNSSVTLECDVPVGHLKKSSWDIDYVQKKTGHIFVFDEDETFVVKDSVDFASAVLNSDNCFVIMSRNPLNFLPDGIKEEYEFLEDNSGGSSSLTYVRAVPISSK